MFSFDLTRCLYQRYLLCTASKKQLLLHIPVILTHHSGDNDPPEVKESKSYVLEKSTIFLRNYRSCVISKWIGAAIGLKWKLRLSVRDELYSKLNHVDAVQIRVGNLTGFEGVNINAI